MIVYHLIPLSLLKKFLEIMIKFIRVAAADRIEIIDQLIREASTANQPSSLSDSIISPAHIEIKKVLET